MDTPKYDGAITIGGKSQTTSSAIGTVLPPTLITRQSGQITLTASNAAGGTFDLSSLNGKDVFAKPFNSAEVPVNMGTGVVSGAGNNIFTVSWVRDKMAAAWSTFEFDKDGTIVLYVEMEETGTADYFQWSTRFNVDDGDYTGDASILPLNSIIFYYNPTYGYDNSTVAADPGAGLFRLDDTTLANVTEMYVADDAESNLDLQTYWQSLGVGSHIYIGNPNVKNDAAYFTVSGAVTNGTGFSTVPLTFVSAGSSQFTSGSLFSFTIGVVSGSAPFSDADPLVKNDADNTKLIGFDASAITTATTRTITMPDTNVDLGDISTNNAKVTNATHTGDVTGATALTLESVAITGQTTVTVDDADFVLISDTGDSGNLKKVLASDFGGGGGNFPSSTIHAEITGAYTVLVGDENTTIPVGSATTADFDITYDVSLWTTAGSQLTITNKSAFIARLVVSNTGTMKIAGGIDKYVNANESLTVMADTSTQVWPGANA